MVKKSFTVTGMTCSACSSHVEKAVSALDGAENVSVNLLTNTLKLEYDENKLDDEAIITAVTNSGYGIQKESSSDNKKKTENSSHGYKKKRISKNEKAFLALGYISHPPYGSFDGTYVYKERISL